MDQDLCEFGNYYECIGAPLSVSNWNSSVDLSDVSYELEKVNSVHQDLPLPHFENWHNEKLDQFHNLYLTDSSGQSSMDCTSYCTESSPEYYGYESPSSCHTFETDVEWCEGAAITEAEHENLYIYVNDENIQVYYPTIEVTTSDTSEIKDQDDFINNFSPEDSETLDLINEIICESYNDPVILPQKPTKEEIAAEKRVKSKFFQCFACEKTFQTRPSLKKHFKCNLHHDSVQQKKLMDPAFYLETWLINPVICPACDEHFQYYYQCVQHIYAKHA